MAEDRFESSSRLPDNLLALPLWAATAAIGLLTIGVGVGFAFLLTPGLNEAERAAGGQVLLIALPALAIATVILGASWSRTARIDAMEKSFLRHTVGDKLKTYLVTPKPSQGGTTLYPPLFKRIDTCSNSSITSFCYFHLFDDKDRRFEMLVKSNVFNIEIAYYLHLATPPCGHTGVSDEHSYGSESLKEWSTVTAADPLLAIVAATIHGSISEGYTAYVQAKPDESGGLNVTYRLRQKLQSNFLTSPYLRRYFSEDVAIASYAFFAEAFTTAGSIISDGEAGALEVGPERRAAQTLAK
jgi:hypothetical protein